MTELAVTSASAALAFLVLYGAAVIFTLERIGDRFGATLLPGFVRRRVVWWFGSLALLVLVGLLVIPLDGPVRAITALVVFVASLVLLTLACYSTWRWGSDVRQMLSIALAVAHPGQTVREILWRAVERADMLAVADSLRAFDRRSPARAELLGWLLGHRSLQDSDWLASEVLDAELEGGLDEAAAEAVRDRLVPIVDGALRREQFELAYTAVDRIMDALRRASPFTDRHGQLVLDVGRTLWLVGDYMGTAPRQTSLPAQLDYLKMIYDIRRRAVWFALLKRGSRAEVDSFVSFLCLFAADTEDGMNVFSLYTDVLIDGGEAGVVSMEALRDLANSMQWMRLHEMGEASRHKPEPGELSPLEAPGEAWNGLFHLLAATAQSSGATDDDIDGLASTYGMLGDNRFMRQVRRDREARRSAGSKVGQEAAPRR
jgi:hypothetical protein